MSDIRFPNESNAYRQARNELLEAEIALRAQTERVAELRRQLPAGGTLKADYVFDELINGEVKQTKFSELFAAGKDTVFLYSFMYAPDMDAACPLCTSILDGLNGQIVHIQERINIAVVAKNPIETIHAYAHFRR